MTVLGEELLSMSSVVRQENKGRLGHKIGEKNEAVCVSAPGNKLNSQMNK